MNGRSYLLMQIEALSEELDSIENSMESLDNKELLHAMRVRFLNLFDERKAELVGLREKLSNKVSSERTLSKEWEQLKGISRNCGDLFLEFEGTMLRSSFPHGNEICRVADSLIYYLNYWSGLEWDRFTVMTARGESFAEMTGIIKVRFPDFTVWRLPLVAHEFGHYAISRITYGNRHPFKNIVEEWINLKKPETIMEKRRLQELFADVFATYIMGPAYAATLILLNLNPRDDLAFVDGITHPNHNKRVYCILKTLKEMSSQDDYSGIIGYLEKAWQMNLESSDFAAISKDLDRSDIGKVAGNWIEILMKARGRAKYNGWARTDILIEALNPNFDCSQEQNAECTLPDVLNAAWRCRIKYADEDSYGENRLMVQEINRKALNLCMKIRTDRDQNILHPRDSELCVKSNENAID
jgi:hypothetical protein